MMTAVRTLMTVSAGLSTIMVISVATIVMMELIVCGMVWLISWRRVSTSLV